MPGSIKNAVATILFFDITKGDEKLFDNYLILSLLLANKLKKIKAVSEKTFESLLFIDKPALAQLKKLNKLDDLIKVFDKVVTSDNHEAYFLKLEVWKHISDYSSIIYLDSDCYIKTEKSLDLLFEETSNIKEQIAACNETTWPDMFNTGVFAINKKTALNYKNLVEQAATFNTLCSTGSEEVELYDNLDQGLLNYVFSDSWKNLSYVFNVQVRENFNQSGSDYASPSETYFVARSDSNPNKKDNKTPENKSYFDTGYFTYANDISKANKKNKFLNKALIVQFMDKPWESQCMDHVAPEYYSGFTKLKETVTKKNDEDGKITEVKEKTSLKKEEAPLKKEEVPVKKKTLFSFPWSNATNYPTSNTREWR
jgi:lipopolysaccharide biosynthesis glycosyltransferase